MADGPTSCPACGWDRGASDQAPVKKPGPDGDMKVFCPSCMRELETLDTKGTHR